MLQVLEYTAVTETQKAGAADASRHPGCRQLDTEKGTPPAASPAYSESPGAAQGDLRSPLSFKSRAHLAGCNLIYTQLQRGLKEDRVFSLPGCVVRKAALRVA